METLDLVEISRFGERYTFKTPVFKEGVDEWLDMSLPPPETVALYGEAAQAWHAGESDRAIGILQSLVNKPWGDIAERQISQYERIASDYQALLEAREADDYQERLLSFRASLKPSQDGYFLSATEEDFELLKKRSLVKLSESLNTIMKQWQEYLDAGGIPGVVRVEQGISDRFKLQAERLSLAYAGISEGAQTYESIQIKPPANWQDLQKQIENETKRQRRWLEDLELVMEPTTLRAKLDLLPEVKETDQ
jgi:hypothetical protein